MKKMKIIKKLIVKVFSLPILIVSILLLGIHNVNAENCLDNMFPYNSLWQAEFTNELTKYLIIEEAEKDYVAEIDGISIFKGKSLECSKNIAGSITKDCCGVSADGFSEGKILKCEEEELEIEKAKEVGRATEIGEYCHNNVIGVCTSYHKTYCLFKSKWARIIQEAARSQLGITFGTPEHPNCRGLTLKEFQMLDLSKIDFSEYYLHLSEEDFMRLKIKNQLLIGHNQ